MLLGSSSIKAARKHIDEIDPRDRAGEGIERKERKIGQEMREWPLSVNTFQTYFIEKKPLGSSQI